MSSSSSYCSISSPNWKTQFSNSSQKGVIIRQPRSNSTNCSVSALQTPSIFQIPTIKTSPADPNVQIAENLSPVTGTIPDVYLRHGANQGHHCDGMIYSFKFHNESVSCVCRFMETQRLTVFPKANGHSGILLFYTRGLIDHTQGIGVANAGLVYFNNPLSEDDVRVTGLETAGRYDFKGQLKSTMIAIDESVFTDLLRTSISQWTQEGKKNMWLTLPSQFVNVAEEKEGFHLCDGSSGNHRFVYKIPEPNGNASHIMSGVEKSELYDVESGELKVRNHMLSVKDANPSDNRRACYMLALTNNYGLQFYFLVIAATGLLLQTFYQAAHEPTLQNTITLAAAFASLFGNIVIAILVFAYSRDKPKNKWISFFFNLTGTLPVYLAFAMLLPIRYICIGVPTICTILTVVECHEKIQKMLKWSFETSVKCLGRCFWSPS